MGILGLSKLIADMAPGAIKESEIKNYFGMFAFLPGGRRVSFVYLF